jgi:PKD repeat protein
MNTDGGGVSQIGGAQGSEPAWSSDGRYIAASGLNCCIYAMKADGSDAWSMTYDDGLYTTSSPSWMPSVPGSPLARFSTSCTGLVCSFDAATSVGAITAYTWSFGDTWTASGPVATHTFADGGIQTVTVTVTDATGATAIEEVTLTLNRPPIASFVPSCSGLTCSFDGRASTDYDGGIVNYMFRFGDGSACGGCQTVTHVYPATGTYSVVLTVRDDSGATDTYELNVTLHGVHIGDLDAASSPGKSSWTASVTLTVHDDAHHPVANAIVTASWSGLPGGPSSCATAESGICTIRADVPNSIGSTTFNVLGVIAGTAFYDAARSHDVDGGTNGTTVTVRRR